MGLYTSGFLDSRDIIADFYPRLQAANEKNWSTLIGTYLSSDHEIENYRWLGQVPTMREWIGPRHEEVLQKFSMSITNRKFEATLPIALDDLRRDKTEQLRVRVGDLAVRTATHWNKILTPLIDTGAAATNGLAYDGQFFFDVDHNESGTNQSNNVTSTECPSADVASTTAPTALEMANILNEGVAYMATLTDDKGEPINQDVKTYVVMVNRGTYLAAVRAALASTQLTGGITNPLLGAQIGGFQFIPILNTRDTSSAEVKLFASSDSLRPFILQEEVGVMTQLLGAGSDEEFKNDRHLFGVKAVRSVGYGMWQSALQITLS